MLSWPNPLLWRGLFDGARPISFEYVSSHVWLPLSSLNVGAKWISRGPLGLKAVLVGFSRYRVIPWNNFSVLVFGDAPCWIRTNDRLLRRQENSQLEPQFFKL